MMEEQKTVKIPDDLYAEFIKNSTKIDIIVELMRHGYVSENTIVAILEADKKEKAFDDEITIPLFKYADFLEQCTRTKTLLALLKNDGCMLHDNEILRILNTELSLEEADKLELEVEMKKAEILNKKKLEEMESEDK